MPSTDRPGFQRATALLTLGGFALRLHGLGFQSLWRDEVDSIHFATRDLASVAAMFLQEGQNGPLYFALLRPWVHVAGATDFALRFSSLFFGVLLVPTVALLGRRLAGDRVGLIGGLLAAISPYLIWYSQELKMYSLIAFLSALSACLLVAALRRDRWRHWIGFAAVVTVGLLCHLLFVLVVPFAVAAFATWPRGPGQSLRRGLVTFAALILPYVPFAAWEVPLWLSPFQTGHPALPFGRMLSSTVFAFGLNAAPSGELLPFVLLAFLLLAGLLLGRSRARHEAGPQSWMGRLFRELGRRRASLFLGLYLAVPFLGLCFISLGMPLFTDRYLIVSTPAFYLLIAVGLVAAGDRLRPLLPVGLLLMALLAARSLAYQSQHPIKSDFRSAARYVRERAAPGEPILFLIPYIERTFRHYYGDANPSLEGPYTNGGMAPDELSRQMAALLGGRGEVWLVSSEPSLWDERGLVPQWLESRGEVVEGREFARVSVYRYQLSQGAPGG